MRLVPPPAPVRSPRRIALVAVAVSFVAGLVAILVTGANSAHLGTLLVGCVALGTVLANALDRRTDPSQAAKR